MKKENEENEIMKMKEKWRKWNVKWNEENEINNKAIIEENINEENVDKIMKNNEENKCRKWNNDNINEMKWKWRK